MKDSTVFYVGIILGIVGLGVGCEIWSEWAERTGIPLVMSLGFLAVLVTNFLIVNIAHPPQGHPHNKVFAVIIWAVNILLGIGIVWFAQFQLNHVA